MHSRQTVKVSFLCGHVRREEWLGDCVEERLELVASSRECPRCEDAATLPSPVILQRVLGLARLEGTEKAVAWAGKIRAEWAVRSLRELTGVFDFEDALLEFQRLQKISEMPRHVLSVLDNGSAKWWIDNRVDPFSCGAA